MSPLQVATEIRDLLAARHWAGVGGNEVVFASVHITARDPLDLLGSFRHPLALISIGADSADEEEPGFIQQDFTVTVAQSVAGDETGQGAIVGQNKSGGTTSSKGRGIGEIEPEVKTVIRDLGNANGIDLLFVATASAGAVPTEVGYVAYRQYTFRASCVTDAA